MYICKYICIYVNIKYIYVNIYTFLQSRIREPCFKNKAIDRIGRFDC